MEIKDVPAGVGLCRHANWNQVQQDWETFLLLSPGGCIVAVSDEKVVGTAATISFGSDFSWIGMVLVDPDFKRLGIGKKLLLETLHLLQNEDTVKLDATPQGRELYLQLDFKDEYRLSRITGSPFTNSRGAVQSLPIEESMLDAIAEYDHKAFGAYRGPLLRRLYAGAPHLARYVLKNDTIAGYAMGRNGHHYTQIGPLVADDLHSAQQLAEDLWQCAGNTRVVMDSMMVDTNWLQWLQSKGFAEERPFIRMFRGKNNFQGVLNRQYTIAGPEFG